MNRNLAWLGVVLFAVSWFVPVVKGQDTANALRELGDEISGSSSLSGPPGWQACRFAWDAFTGKDSAQGGEGWKARVCGSSCLTNLAMLLAVFLLVGRKAGVGTMGVVLLACAALDLSWVYLGGDGRSSLAAGYWLWVASFALVGLGLLGRE